MSDIKRFLYIIITLCFFGPLKTKAFSILAHEAVIDASWEHQLKPLLLAKYPGASAEQLKTAHAYAYGGCLMPDMGYMPMGNPYFTNLVHYVRSGDFVMELIHDANDLNEYAFALGALSHYIADEYGHSLATNRTVPLVYPNLEQKFGTVVTYADDHTSHTRMEFAYDVIQVAGGNYASIAYHDFIGFSMSERLLDQAFLKIYGQDLNDVFKNYSSTISTFRWGVRDMFPQLLNKAWRGHKAEIMKAHPEMTHAKFKYRMTRKMFQKEFGSDYQRPDFKARLVVFLIRVLPKIGPLKKLKFKSPGAQGEKYFAQSMDTILRHYAVDIKHAGNNTLQLANMDFDTGSPTTYDEYALTNSTYNDWVLAMDKQNFISTDEAMKQNILKFYSKADTATMVKPSSQQSQSKVDPAQTQKALAAINRMKAIVSK